MYYERVASMLCQFPVARIVSTMETKLSVERSVEAAPRNQTKRINGRRALVEGNGGLTLKNAEAPAE
jgi:hypothetical protein